MHSLPSDDKGNTRILAMIDTYCRVHLPALRSIQYPAFRNEHSFSKEENGLVERANQEIMHHLRTMLFDARVHDKWSYEKLPMVQRIMNTAFTRVTSIRLSNRILSPPGSINLLSQVALSDTMDNWVA
jgi:hypothetical protein